MYEQVSPLDKGGIAAYPFTAPSVWTAATGERIAYLGSNAFSGAGANTALYAAHVSTRTPVGWRTEDWTPAETASKELKAYVFVEYAFSEDLTQTALQVPLATLTPEALPYLQNLYVRHSDGSLALVNSLPPAFDAGQLCEPGSFSNCWQEIDQTAFAGASTDFSHILFESTAQFMPQAPPTGTPGLYENDNGQVHLVGYLPDGTPAATSTAGAGASVVSNGGENVRRLERAISADGSRVVFQAPADGGLPDEAQTAANTEVYERIGGMETVELSAPAPGANPANPAAQSATFWAASADGSRVFFTSSAELTTQSNTGPGGEGEDLYEYDFSKPLAERLTDLTADGIDVAGADVLGVLGDSADGSYVYFVAHAQLDPGSGTAGQPNLYVVHDGGPPSFIATLSSAGTPTNPTGQCHFATSQSADSCDWSPFPEDLEAYVTPDGSHLAFMSTGRLPTVEFPAGYDNRDLATGEPDSEVYEYSAPPVAGEAGRLICASCEQDGSRPAGNALIGGISRVGEVAYEAIGSPFIRARALSDNGARLFYTAPSAGDTSIDKVYEFEQPGEGDCTGPGPCQRLISASPEGEFDFFLGASSTGTDVFIASTARLLSGDGDDIRDVYDARVDGGFPSTTTTACEVDCRTVAGPPPSAPSTGQAGPSGNLPPPPPPHSGGKPPTRAQLLARALKACHAKHDRRRRARCEAQARRRYGARRKTGVHHTNNTGRNG